MKKSNHSKTLLIDFGNSYAKYGLVEDEQIIEFAQSPIQTNVLESLSQFKNLDNVDKVFILTNTRIEDKLLMLKAKFAKAEFKLINKDDFKDLLDLSNIDKEVVIGNDILLLGYWITKQKDIKSVICLGTVYLAIIMNGKQFKSTVLLPSLVKGLEQIQHQSSIPSDLMPAHFDKTVGLNTPDSFASGLNLALNGFVKQLLETYKLNQNQIVITGGDCNKYDSLKNYNIIDHLTLKALLVLIKEKHW